MDELLLQIRDACEGLSVEEIADQIAASQYAEAIENPMDVAQLLAALCESVVEDSAQVAPDQETTAPESGND